MHTATNHRDKLGFYQVGDHKFYNKIQAIQHQTKTGQHPRWIFNDPVFAAQDWTQEPTESLSELYRRRAQQLRDRYDYIILMYSSGADSQNILDTFVDNDIALDEICSFVNWEATGNRYNYLNFEIYQYAIDRAQRAQSQQHGIRHRVLDLSQYMLDSFQTDGVKHDWIYTINNFFSPNTVARLDLALKVPEWADLINQGKRVCILWGPCKPRIYHERGRFLMKFLDIIDTCISDTTGAYNDEFFYWQPDVPEIIIKQCHVVRRYLSQPNLERAQHITPTVTHIAYREIEGRRYWLTPEGLHQLIYPTWNSQGMQFVGKTISLVISTRDFWFYDIEDTHDSKRNFNMALQKLSTEVPESWRNDARTFSMGIKGTWSRSYFLERDQ